MNLIPLPYNMLCKLLNSSFPHNILKLDIQNKEKFQPVSATSWTMFSQMTPPFNCGFFLVWIVLSNGARNITTIGRLST